MIEAGRRRPRSRADRGGRVRLRHVRFAELPEADRRRAFAEMARVAARALGLSEPFEHSWLGARWASRCQEFADHSEGYLARQDGELVAFFVHHTEELEGRPHTHLSSAYVVPELQGRGLAFAANARAVLRMLLRHPFSEYWLSGSVYNPIAVEGWRRRAPLDGSFFPRIGASAEPDPELVEFVSAVARRSFPDEAFDPRSGVLCARSEPRDTFPQRCRNEEVDRYFDDHVDPRNGDVLLFALNGTRPLLWANVFEVLRAVPRAVATAARPRRRR